MLKRTSTVLILCYLEKSCQTCEDFEDGMRTILSSADFFRSLLAMTHRNPIRHELNYNESAALIDAHLKRYKFRTEADIVATQSSIDWRISGATSLVKDQDQNCRMYSTTEGIAVKAQQFSTM